MLINPIKVLTIGRFYPPHHGGIERHIDDLLQGLGKSLQADCIVVDNTQAIEPTENSLSYTLYKVRAITTVASTPISPSMLYLTRKLHRKNSYHILHLHFPNPMAHLVAQCLPKNIKLVITWHSDIVKQKKLLQFYQPFLKKIIKRADAIIAATPAHFSSSKQLMQWGNQERFFVVPYGINTTALTSIAADSLSVNAIKEKYQPEKIIFAVGRHVYYKGYEYLIQAMQNISNAVLLLGGKGPLTENLKTLANSLHLQERIVFLGYIPEEQLATYYHAADIFCLPSVEKSEAFGLVQLEAMACKKPVVCCELYNGVNYVNQNNITGLVVPPRDPCALAQAINTLLQDETLRLKMGTHGYNRVITEFTQAKMWQETLMVYNKILGNE